jgi:hypothetical protein
MNIPLDNLYHWIKGLSQHPVVLYVFHPPGSKDIFDLISLDKNQDQYSYITPKIICHDQEPLDFSVHQFDSDLNRLADLINHRWKDFHDQPTLDAVVEQFTFAHFHRKYWSDIEITWLNVLADEDDWTILLHSEINSKDVERFASVRFLPVYYWCHAIIARDWYRFAQFDSRLQNRAPTKTFLVYCRDWTPRREYRLKFLDLVVKQNLTNDCVISTQHVNNQGVHLRDYQVQNPQFAGDIAAIL